jgi:hypothetical protein
MNALTVKKTKYTPFSYEFKEWKLAFARFFTERKKGHNVVLIISTHFTTYGYWIEKPPAKVLKTSEFVYRDAEVISLKLRIKKRLKQIQPGNAPGLVI